MSKKRKNIEGFVLVLAFPVILFFLNVSLYWLALVVFVPWYIISMVHFVRMLDRRRSPLYKLFKALKTYNIKVLDKLLKEASTDFTYEIAPSYIAQYNMIRDKLELFSRMVIGDAHRIILQRREFLDMKNTDSKYYEYVIMYSMFFLLENDIENFLKHFGYYKRSITDRVEHRVLDEKLNVIEISKYKIVISMELLELMYKYYEHHENIKDDLFKYRPTNKLEEYIHITYTYYYLVHSENDRLARDFRAAFDEYQIKKRNK